MAIILLWTLKRWKSQRPTTCCVWMQCVCMWIVIVRIQSVRLPLDCSARSLSPKENHRTQKNENLYNIVGLLCARRLLTLKGKQFVSTTRLQSQFLLVVFFLSPNDKARITAFQHFQIFAAYIHIAMGMTDSLQEIHQNKIKIMKIIANLMVHEQQNKQKEWICYYAVFLWAFNLISFA